MASPSTVITLGYGNGTLTGSPALVLTLGYGIGEALAPYIPRRFYLPRSAVPVMAYLPRSPVRQMFSPANRG